MMQKKIRTASRIILVLILIFIWGNSLKTAEESARISGSVTEAVIETVEKVTGQDASGKITDHAVRKFAHLSQFFALGFFACLSFELRLMYLVAGGVLSAFIDESIQIFSPGRGPQITDVFIDTAGFVLGLFLSCVICLFINRYFTNKNKIGGKESSDGK